MAHRHKKAGDKLGFKGHASQIEKGGDKGDDYSGSGKPDVVKEARSEKDGFKKGGKVHGKKHKGHMGKHHYARGGRSPFSSAHVKTNGDA